MWQKEHNFQNFWNNSKLLEKWYIFVNKKIQDVEFLAINVGD